MNERIKLLAELSKTPKTMMVDGVLQSVVTINAERFAELIVRDCAAEADKQTIYCRGIPWGKWIKQHFGVEE